MYQALYRKWRPKTFSDVVGQAHISETLRRQVDTDRLSHAYLFVGTRGTGKTTCAKILAKAINCTNPQNGDPCNACPSCLGIDGGAILDVLELDAASNNGVDNVRALRDEAVYTPVDVKKRVYIVDEVHMLSGAAFNALLKILEEPPEHLVFILATTEIHKVPATILSRCQRFTFKRILPEKIRERLLTVAGREGLDLTEDAAALLSRMADGSLRDALSLLDQCAWGERIDTDRVLSAIGLAGGTEILKILAAAADGDAAGALSVLDGLYDAGKVMASVLEELTDLVRDILVVSLLPGGGLKLLTGGFDLPVLESLKNSFADAELMEMLDILRETMSELTKNSGGRLAVELCLMRLCRLRMGGAPEATARQAPPARPRAVEKAPPVIITKDEAPERPLADGAPRQPEPAIGTNAAVTPPVDDPAEAPPSDASSDATGDVWADIVRALPKLEDAATAALNEAKALLEGRLLTIAAKNIFDQAAVNDPLNKDIIRQTAEAVTKLPVEVRVILDDGTFTGAGAGVRTAVGAPGASGSKLDAALKKGFIKVED